MGCTLALLKVFWREPPFQAFPFPSFVLLQPHLHSYKEAFEEMEGTSPSSPPPSGGKDSLLHLFSHVPVCFSSFQSWPMSVSLLCGWHGGNVLSRTRICCFSLLWLIPPHPYFFSSVVLAVFSVIHSHTCKYEAIPL